MEKQIIGFRILKGLHSCGPYKNFSATGKGMHSEGTVVEFTTSHGEKWIGNFQPGEHGGNGYSTVEMHPNKHYLIIAAGGQGYIVDPESQQCISKLGSDIQAIIPYIDLNMLVFLDEDDIVAFGVNGVLYKYRIANMDRWDDSYVDRGSLFIDHNQLKGKILNNNYAGFTPFVVHLKDGKVEYGEFQENN